MRRPPDRTFLFGALVGTDVEATAELFTDASDPDDIAAALGSAWRRRPSSPYVR